MKTRLLLLSLSLSAATAISLHAKLIRHFTMTEQIPRAAIVVYCEEKEVKPQENTQTLVKCVVLKTIKGDIAPGAELTVLYGPLFQRTLSSPHGGKPDLPPAKALIFLQRDGAGALYAIDAKLVQDGKVFEFTQMDNPGPLVPWPAKPENITLAEDQPYGEKELLDDVAAAAKKAAAAAGADAASATNAPAQH